jgi:uncharacterized protein
MVRLRNRGRIHTPALVGETCYRMGTKRAALLICGLAVAASLATAQESSKETKIQRLLSLTNAQATMNQVFDQMKSLAASQLPPNATPEQRAKAQKLQTSILDLVKARMSWDKLRPQYVKLYGETFSDEEIDGMLAFYQSPAGRAMLEKMPVLLPKLIALSQAQMGELMPEIQRIVSESRQR